MRKIISVILVGVVSGMFASLAMAENLKVGIVNMTQLFNDSPYVQKANKTLQTNAKDMESKIQAQQKKVQDLVNQYNAMKTATPARDKLQKQILTEQTALNQMNQDFQQKIRDEQSLGMQQFNTMVHAAVEKVAKEKKFNTILSSTAVLFSDNAWVDVTKDVATAMQ